MFSARPRDAGRLLTLRPSYKLRDTIEQPKLSKRDGLFAFISGAFADLSPRRSPFQIEGVLREENGIFRDVVAIRE